MDEEDEDEEVEEEEVAGWKGALVFVWRGESGEGGGADPGETILATLDWSGIRGHK